MGVINGAIGNPLVLTQNECYGFRGEKPGVLDKMSSQLACGIIFEALGIFERSDSIPSMTKC